MHTKLASLLVVLTKLGMAFASVIPEGSLLPRQETKEGSFGGPIDRNLTVIRVNDNAIGGERYISYFTTREGHVIIDGDVVYEGDENALLSKRVAAPPSSFLVSDQSEKKTVDENDKKEEKRWHSVMTGQGKDWPSGRMKYRFPDAATKSKLSGLVSAAKGKWRQQAPWITFSELPFGQPEHGVVQITSTSCGGCWSTVGYSASTMRYMNLQVDGCDSFCGVEEAVHEFGHALGFQHEHQRADRSNYVVYDCASLSPGCSNLPWYLTCCAENVQSLYPGCCSAAPNFEKYSTGYAYSSGAYDTFSIMHYTRTEFARPGKVTLTGLNGVSVPYAHTSALSSWDKQRACTLYQGTCNAYNTCVAKDCPSTCQTQKPCHSPKCGTDFEPACCNADEDANAACLAKRKACTQAGCDLFIN